MKDDKLYLSHIMECIRRIELYIAPGWEQFYKSTMMQDAIIRNFEIIGEATKKISKEFRNAHPNIPWQEMAGFRDVLIHNYMGIDLEEVWRTATRDLPELKKSLSAISLVQEILQELVKEIEIQRPTPKEKGHDRSR